MTSVSNCSVISGKSKWKAQEEGPVSKYGEKYLILEKGK